MTSRWRKRRRRRRRKKRGGGEGDGEWHLSRFDSSQKRPIFTFKETKIHDQIGLY